ncbi:MAG: hypothetical protein J5881_03240 [Clostridia bacterium]|nr:hypothetical protein [Clostridia bacterium]
MEDLEKNNASADEKRYFNNFNYNPFFSIFGFDLYSDDILILCILFSMYMEGIKDQMLFLLLLLLLFS